MTPQEQPEEKQKPRTATEEGGRWINSIKWVDANAYSMRLYTRAHLAGLGFSKKEIDEAIKTIFP